MGKTLIMKTEFEKKTRYVCFFVVVTAKGIIKHSLLTLKEMGCDLMEFREILLSATGVISESLDLRKLEHTPGTYPKP